MNDSNDDPDFIFVIFGGIAFAAVCLGCWRGIIMSDLQQRFDMRLQSLRTQADDAMRASLHADASQPLQAHLPQDHQHDPQHRSSPPMAVPNSGVYRAFRSRAQAGRDGQQMLLEGRTATLQIQFVPIKALSIKSWHRPGDTTIVGYRITGTGHHIDGRVEIIEGSVCLDGSNAWWVERNLRIKYRNSRIGSCGQFNFHTNEFQGQHFSNYLPRSPLNIFSRKLGALGTYDRFEYDGPPTTESRNDNVDDDNDGVGTADRAANANDTREAPHHLRLDAAQEAPKDYVPPPIS
mmetsp:Transcript_13757/g.37830  ORF Transcript_13757/g.37830 Transcript_13757/m.37830 type:complete len:292 (-) Transcript_13757:92-967(-)